MKTPSIWYEHIRNNNLLAKKETTLECYKAIQLDALNEIHTRTQRIITERLHAHLDSMEGSTLEELKLEEVGADTCYHLLNELAVLAKQIRNIYD